MEIFQEKINYICLKCGYKIGKSSYSWNKKQKTELQTTCKCGFKWIDFKEIPQEPYETIKEKSQ